MRAKISKTPLLYSLWVWNQTFVTDSHKMIFWNFGILSLTIFKKKNYIVLSGKF